MRWFTNAFPALRPLRASAVAATRAALLAATVAGPAGAATENRNVADFDEVVFAVAGEVDIRQGPRETLLLDAEPAVLRKITSEVQGRRLLIGLLPGRVETAQPIRIKLGVRSLRLFELRTVGAVSIGPLITESLGLRVAGGGSIRVDRLENALALDVRITGAGEVAVAGGKVKGQQLAISGTGTYVAPTLASERAEVAIDGSGNVQLAASSALSVRIAGVGHVRYRGDPAVTRSITGIGTIEKD